MRAKAAPQVNFVYVAHFWGKIHDGDTFDLMVDLGFRGWSEVRVRLHNIDVYELSTPVGPSARDWVYSLLMNAQEIKIQSYKDDHSFERWVCDVWVDGTLINDLIRVAGYEKPK